MRREAESKLLKFCVQQRENFVRDDWINFREVEKSELAACAVFLSQVDWYPHGEVLRELAEELHEGSSRSISGHLRATRFDCSRFSNMLRGKLAHETSAAS